MGSVLWLALGARWRWLGLLGLLQAMWLPGWSMVRLLVVQIVAWRQRRAPGEVRLFLCLALILDRFHAAEWSGQDFASSLLLFPWLLWPWKNWRRLAACLAMVWTVQACLDWFGCWGWLRPMPHPQEWGALPLHSSPVYTVTIVSFCALTGHKEALGILLITWGVGGRPQSPPAAVEVKKGECDWLLFSNNPERCRGDLGGTLLEETTPPGRGRVLVSHINLGRPADLVLSCACEAATEISLVSVRDGSLTDPGSKLLQQKPQKMRLSAGESWQYRLRGLVLNGIIQAEVTTRGKVHWRVSWGEAGPLLQMREGQSRGLYLDPDRRVYLRTPGSWQWDGPWIKNTQGEPLLGNYGCLQTLVIDSEHPVELCLLARGGVLGAVDGRPGPVLPAGRTRVLHYPSGHNEIKLWLPVNSFAPYTLIWR